MARGIGWGDVRMVEFGSPDKVRPALVLTRDSAIPYLNVLAVAPITRSIRGMASEVRVGAREGLKIESVANFDQMQTLPRVRIGRWLGSLAQDRRDEVREAVLFALGLD